ncbi:hypothetical protein TFKS16_0960 [Tannerella forsythia KS16]|uniref:Uncharacterized protein n=1 Tax=Tannerella forsythia TaxID=28112 RepID=A0A2A6EBP1_TANFO|nr:hypothetical protein Tanf_02170 [Tannerella forsythia]OLQ20137.1 hypothetical protein BGK60_04190 [Tannerella forsythia]PDP44867.1 hypothetical protein CLI86_01815 [Tannerella forsythia]PDP72057.1 hypothetical protein CLI85_00250 [Tannerella forsythia]BAR51243.1 hypothetical protein TFKS16_0960 [Tannerella forsythia KS16]
MTLLLCSDKFFTRTPSVTATKKRFVLCGFFPKKTKDNNNRKYRINRPPFSIYYVSLRAGNLLMSM